MKNVKHPKLIKVSVSNVAIPNGTVRRVRFSARARSVVVRTTGLPAIKVTPIKGLRAVSTKFEAFAKNDPTTVYMGKTPAQAFANAAKYAWA